MARWRTYRGVSPRSALGVGLLSVLLVLAVLASPLLMMWATSLPISWDRLSDVGQAYGAVSAILAALAFVGIAVSLVVQGRQHLLAHQHVMRERHFQLMQVTLDEPAYFHCWGSSANDESKLFSFCNLIIGHWLFAWRVRDVDEAQLRSLLARFFGGAVGRAYWEQAGEGWSAPPAQAAFGAIVTDEYRKAVAAGPPVTGWPVRQAERPAPRSAAPSARAVTATGITVGVAVGLLAAFALGAARSARRTGHR